MKSIIKEVLDEHARNNFYSDTFRNYIAGEIEKRLGEMDKSNNNISTDVKSNTGIRRQSSTIQTSVKNNVQSVDNVLPDKNENVKKDKDVDRISKKTRKNKKKNNSKKTLFGKKSIKDSFTKK